MDGLLVCLVMILSKFDRESPSFYTFNSVHIHEISLSHPLFLSLLGTITENNIHMLVRRDSTPKTPLGSKWEGIPVAGAIQGPTGRIIEM